MDLAPETEDTFPDPIDHLPGALHPASQPMSPEVPELRNLHLLGRPEERGNSLATDLIQ